MEKITSRIRDLPACTYCTTLPEAQFSTTFGQQLGPETLGGWGKGGSGGRCLPLLTSATLGYEVAANRRGSACGTCRALSPPSLLGELGEGKVPYVKAWLLPRKPIT